MIESYHQDNIPDSAVSMLNEMADEAREETFKHLEEIRLREQEAAQDQWRRDHEKEISQQQYNEQHQLERKQ